MNFVSLIIITQSRASPSIPQPEKGFLGVFLAKRAILRVGFDQKTAAICQFWH